MEKDILLCGVGGQGTVLASKLLAAAAMEAGLVVHSAETIGMAQRGGSVTSHVRIGEDQYSPLIPRRGADIMLSFEPGEAVRNLDYLKKDGIVIVNLRPVKPVTESLQDTGYDGKEMIAYLKDKVKNVVSIDSEEIAKKLGSSKGFNVAILGVLAGTKRLGIDCNVMIKAIENSVKKEFVELNKKAFNIGKEIGEGYYENQ